MCTTSRQKGVRRTVQRGRWWVAPSLLAVLGLLVTPVCALAADRTRPGGALIEDRLLATIPAGSVRSELDQARIAPGDPALGGGAVRDGVVAYRVLYRTTDALGRPVTASGLVAFPSEPAGLLRVVVYEHGTTADRQDVPSAFGLDTGGDGLEGRWSAELFASAGFAVVEPDYVGMGEGTGRPEYMVAKSEVSASLGLLDAGEYLAARRGGGLDRDVLVTGFSQGGAAAMAFGHALDSGADTRFELRALAPVSGPYDLTGAELPGMFNGQVDPAMASYYLGYTLTAWNPIYRLYGRPAEAYQAPYAASIEGLFDGSHTDQTIAESLPPDVRDLLTPAYLQVVQHPSGALRRALLTNSTCEGWAPSAPTRLYAAAGDRTVTEVNADHCQRALARHGVNVPLVQLGPVDHDVSDFVALPQIVSWFGSSASHAS